MRARHSPSLGHTLSVALVILALGAGIAWWRASAGRAESGLERALSAAQAGRTDAAVTAAIDDSRRTAIVEAAEQVGPAVVSVNVVATQVVRQRSIFDDPFMDPFFRGVFPPRELLRQVQSLGSGFIVSDDGYVVTNHHVVSGATEIVVTLIDGRQYAGRLVASDPVTDLAVLKVDAEDLPTAPLGDSDNLLIGEWAIAIGNPFGYLLADREPSVTVGVISALGRDVRPEVGDGPRPQVWSNMIQTDAAINPGNSGGPLVNAGGEVIGVNAFIFSGTGGSIGLGFAIPINRAKRVLSDIVRFGSIRHPWTGLHLEPLESGAGSPTQGVRVVRIDPGSPAARTGVRAGDIITASDGRALPSTIEWEGRLLDLPTGQPLMLTVERDRRAMEITLTPEQDPLVLAPRLDTPYGARLVVVDETLASYLGLRSRAGLYLDQVSPGSGLRRIGLREGDVVVALGDRPLDSPDDVEFLVAALDSGQPLALYAERDGVITRILVR
ncbi:MAG TPA: trypsin-like peptidase domain-containing protein [Gemmatimonadota bacterium]|nr:trypsin-like peptidase domain-containing protein [Gemmatimonadota bacterium]